ncbi:contactin-3-like isoform X2 [Oscarella lobularis]|uniref:contactin-3-like isoform X2 n=1 Tax=Oscarella lobularis TaxID=121494 RepID=UPI003313B8E0
MAEAASSLVIFLLLSRLVNQIDAVVDPPVIVSMPDDLIGAKGKTYTFACAATGTGPLVVTWYKDDQLIADSRLTKTASGGLQITNFQSKDEGLYHCIVSNVAGRLKSRVARATVANLGSFSGAQRVKDVSFSGYVELACDPPSSVPDASIYWKHQSSVVDLSQGTFMMKSNGDLIVNRASQSSGGHYTCHARNSVLNREVKSMPVFVSLTGLASVNMFAFLEEPSNSEVIVGNVATFKCVVADDQRIPAVTWYKGSTKLTSGGRIQLLEFNRALQINNVRTTDAGIYKCQSNSITRTATLTVLVPSVIVNGPVTTQSLIGVAVTLRCNVTGSPTPAIVWYKDGSSYPTAAEIDGSLIIGQVREADSGVYQCRASNKAGEAFASAHLNVSGSKPVFNKFLPPVTHAIATRRLELPCSAVGSPAPTYAWLYQGLAVRETNVVRPLLSGNLSITNVKLQHGGKYTCTATNPKGSINQSTILKIYNPTQFISSSSNVYLKRGLDAVLSCRVTSDAALSLSFEWKRANGVIVTSSAKHVFSSTGDELTIQSIDDADNGQYQCVIATSKDGTKLQTISKTIDLHVQDLPGRPSRVVASKASATGCSLQWRTQTFTGNSIGTLTFHIEYNSSASPNEFVSVGAVVGRHYDVLVSGLDAYVEYQFRVTAENEIGVGKPSALSQVLRTLEAAPTAFPLGLRAQQLPSSATDALLFSWDLTPSPGVNGPVKRYHFRYRALPRNDSKVEEDWTVKLLDPDALTYTLTQLRVHAVYAASIRVENSVDLGPWSPTYYAQTGESPPSGIPNIQEITNVTSHSVNIRFEKIPSQLRNGILRGYKVSYRVLSDGSPAKVWDVSSTDVAVAIVLDLIPNTDYAFSVSAYNNAGSGPSSPEKKATTLEAVPGPVVDVALREDVGNGLVQVAWKPPVQANGQITGYSIAYFRVGDGTENGRRFLPSDSLKATLTDFESNSTYEMTVRAETSVGPGSEVRRRFTFGPGFPGPPVDVSAEWKGNEISLKWNKPVHIVSSDVIAYKIEYSRKSESDWTVYDIIRGSLEVILPDTVNEISIDNLDFRVAASNELGYGSPANFHIQILGSPTEAKPFYEEIWFWGLAAGVGAVILLLLLLVIILCVKRAQTRRRYEVEKEAERHKIEAKEKEFELAELDDRFPSAQELNQESAINVNHYSSTPRLGSSASLTPESMGRHNTEAGEDDGSYYDAQAAAAAAIVLAETYGSSHRLKHFSPAAMTTTTARTVTPTTGLRPSYIGGRFANGPNGAVVRGIRRLPTPSSVGFESTISSDVDRPELTESEFSYEPKAAITSSGSRGGGGSATLV